MVVSELYKSLIYIFLLLASSQAIAQEGIKWYTWEEGMVKAQNEDKKFVIDLYTEWCGWCKKMDATTFTNPEVAQFINDNYIAIRFDAERREDIEFQGQIYKYIKSGKKGYHTLAAKITNGRLSYPTVVFLDEQKELIQAIPGFQSAKTFVPILHFFSYDMHKKMPWATFLREYEANKMASSPQKHPKNHNVLVGGKKN